MSDQDAGPPYCERCGRPRTQGDHTSCDHALGLEPPRYCARCRRRMVVQVTPARLDGALLARRRDAVSG